MRLAAVSCALLILGMSCANAPPDPVATPRPYTSPTSAPPWSAQVDADDVAAERHAREITLRVRNLACGSVGVGSAVAIGPRLLATNRHVVEGASRLEISTWDGRTVSANATDVAQDQDLGIVRVDVDLPAVAQTGPDPAIGARVTAVGFPGAGPFERLSGNVVDYVDGSVFGESSRIMRVTIPVRSGNSGGAVLNERGEIVGVVFALERATGHGLVIPASALNDAVARAAFAPSPGC